MGERINAGSDVRLNTERPPYNDPLAHVIGDALTALGDGEYVTTFDEDDTFDRVVTVVTEYVRRSLDAAGSGNDTERLRTALRRIADNRGAFGDYAADFANTVTIPPLYNGGLELGDLCKVESPREDRAVAAQARSRLVTTAQPGPIFVADRADASPDIYAVRDGDEPPSSEDDDDPLRGES